MTLIILLQIQCIIDQIPKDITLKTLESYQVSRAKPGSQPVKWCVCGQIGQRSVLPSYWIAQTHKLCVVSDY